VNRRRTSRRLLPAAFAVYLADQVTKAAAVMFLTGDGPRVGPFALTLVRNSGAAFSALADHTWALTAAASAALILLITYRRPVLTHLPPVAYAAACAGIAGNLTDRILRSPAPFNGHVVDFIAVGTFPVFNLADVALTAAVAVYAATLLRPGSTGRHR
jgi:signal peptidase II